MVGAKKFNSPDLRHQIFNKVIIIGSRVWGPIRTKMIEECIPEDRRYLLERSFTVYLDIFAIFTTCFFLLRCLRRFCPLGCYPETVSNLVAPYCAIPRDYLSDTPLLRAMGFLVSQHGQLGAIPPPPFLSVLPLKSMRSGGAIPPPTKGVSQWYLRDILRKQGKSVRYPPRKGIARYGGVSRTGPLRSPTKR